MKGQINMGTLYGKRNDNTQDNSSNLYNNNQTKNKNSNASRASHICFDSRRIAVLLFGFVFIFYCWMSWFEGFSTDAVSKIGYAYINTQSTSLAVRSNAGTEYQLLDRLPKNSQIMVLDSALDTNGNVWYQVEYIRGQNQLRTGFVHSSYVVFYNDIAPVGEDPDFEKFLEGQSFPESYKVYLRVLHKEHPSWIFNAQHINLDWSVALKEESKVGVNMISKSYPYSYRSMEKGAYNWDSGEWIYLDSGCFGASSTITAHYLDPRNSLSNDTAVFQFEDLSYIPELQNAENTFSILKGTFLAGDYSFKAMENDFYPAIGLINKAADKNEKSTYKYTYLQTIMDAAKYSQVSPYFLASRLRQEMGVSGTELSFGEYPGLEGYFNFFNIGAYAHSGRSARENGARYAKNNDEEGSYLRPWTNPYRAILGGSDFLGSGYIRKEQNTLYLQKYDVTDGGNGLYNHQYMSNVNAPTSEASSMKKAYTSAGLGDDHIFSFNIPVFKNMPELAAAQPYSDDKYASNNNWLSSLAVSNATLSPAFSRTTYEYTVTVPANTTKVTISAKALDKNATILEAGVVNLTGNKTEHVVSVLAPSFELRTYKISIVKSNTVSTAKPTATPTTKPTTTPSAPTISPTSKPDPKIASKIYNISTNLTGVQPETSIDSFLKNFSVSNGSIQVMDKDGNSKGSGYISTGDKLNLYKDKSLFKAYPIIIYGDINGDGKISLLDMVHIQRQLLEIDNKKGIYFYALDVNNDSKCSLLDMVIMQRHLLGIKSIVQGN